MSRLENLRRIADETLGGLDADAGLKARILSQAAAHPRTRKRPFPVAAVSAASAIVLAVGCVAVSRRMASPQDAAPYTESAQEETMPAAEAPSSENAAKVYTPAKQENLITTMAAGEAVDQLCETALLSVKSDKVSVSSASSDSQTLWESGNGSSFPMVRVDGRYYRLLSASESVASSALGKAVGSVEVCTAEPSLASSDGVMSNVLPEGTAVYAVKGMEHTLMAAEYNGNLRVFQRVSFSGHALKGSESLSDTLNIRGHITGMSLSGVGTVSGASLCDRLFDVLTASASFESTGSLSGKQCLMLTLDNGVTLQMIVKGDRLAACGVWSCPEFMEAFEDACK